MSGSTGKASPPAKSFGLARLRKQRGRQQVAAVCYRVCNRTLEFLLVQTRSGRWTFPKGGVKPGLTHSQSAALEASEEAGVHGRIEELAFSNYARHSRGTRGEPPVRAHLCEVLRLVPPPEANRKPTWFSAEKTKYRLRTGRALADASELARVVDRAVQRIHRLGQCGNANDALQKVRFEAPEVAGQVQALSFFRYLRRQGNGCPPELEIAVKGYLGRFFGIGSGRFAIEKSKPRLPGTGSEETERKLRFIDHPRPAMASNRAARQEISPKR